MADQTQEIEVSIQQELSSLPKSPDNLCIYKVPEHIYEINRECYMPSIVSIGPMYYNNPSLKSSSQELKLRHLQCFLDYCKSINQNDSLSQYIDIIKGWEEVARSYYEETTSLSSYEFIKMMVVDAVFIIYYFMKCSACQFSISEDPMRKRESWMMKVEQDLFLQENQLPLFVINNVYDKAFGAAYPHISFEDLICNAIGSMSSIPGVEAACTYEGREKVREASNIKHLVDFLRVLCLPSNLRDHSCPIKNEISFPPTVKELKAAGVKFIASDSKNLLDISFSKGVLQIPTLTIQDNTEAILRNIIIFEQCEYYYDSYFIDYMVFLDELIDTTEDVKILTQHGIIKNWLGSDEELTAIINRITKHILIYNPKFYYTDVSQNLNAYGMVKWNKWKAVLRRDYFNHPWSIISVVYLVLLLILTLLQVYTGFKK